MEYGGTYVGHGYATAHQILYVGLGKHAAAGGNGMMSGGCQGQVVHLLIGQPKQLSHLVDKGPCASGTVAIHAQVGTSLAKEYYLGVLAADINQSFRFREPLAGEIRCRHYLLYKLGTEQLCRLHANRACNCHGHMAAANYFSNIGKEAL